MTSSMGETMLKHLDPKSNLTEIVSEWYESNNRMFNEDKMQQRKIGIIMQYNESH